MLHSFHGKTAAKALGRAVKAMSDKCIAVFCLLLAVLAAFISFPQGTFAAPDEANIGMEVSAGYDDTVRVGYHVPFKVVLFNQGQEISGELQVIVNADSDSRVAYAAPVNLPEGSSKEIVMYVPVYTANRKAEIRLVSNGKIIKSREYQFKNMVSPETPVIGVLTDDPEPFRALNGIQLDKAVSDDLLNKYYTKISISGSPGVIIKEMVGGSLTAEIVFLDSMSFPDRKEALDGFDVIIIDNVDVSLLNESQADAIEKWVSDGNTLVIGTGTNWKNSYARLKDSLKPFSIEGTEKLESAGSLGTFTEKAPPEGSLEVAVGDIGDGRVMLEEGNIPLAVSYKKDNGTIIILAFDSSLEPIAGWDGFRDMWAKIINSASAWSGTGLGQGPGAKSQTTLQASRFQHLMSDVPETKTPPFTMLLVIICIYVLLVGPVIYFILKWKDKRDWNWVVVPVASLVFMMLIYIVGYKTRYTTAVINNFSVINVNQSSGNLDISTLMGLFNNRRGNMNVQYAKDLGVEFSYTQHYYGAYPGMGYSDENRNGRVVSKFTDSDPAVFELYDARMWEPAYATASQQRPFQGNFMNEVSIRDGKFEAVITNTTGLDMYDAFIAIGNNFASIGNIPAGESKSIRVDLTGADSIKRFNDFLDAKYPQSSYGVQQGNQSDDLKENMRKRNIFRSAYEAIYSGGLGSINIHFFALNYDDLGYELTVNQKKPEQFNTNLIYSNAALSFRSGSNVDMPAGIIRPVLPDNRGAYYENPMDGSISIHDDGDIEFVFMLPEGVKAEYFRINWSPFSAYYSGSGTLGQSQAQQNSGKYKYYIFNNVTQEWEETEKDFASDSNPDAYIVNGEIRVKANVTLDRTSRYVELVSPPEIEIRGVAE